MAVRIRDDVAAFYDLADDFPDDLSFYAEQTSPQTEILELGCGTGRVLVPTAALARYVCGVDESEAMLAECRRKLKAADIPAGRAEVMRADVTRLDLGRRFDLVTAPFRVFQNLETDDQVAGFFRSAREHLAPDGSLIVTAFKPWYDTATLKQKWCNSQEEFCWEAEVAYGKVTCHQIRPRMDSERMVVYPVLIYRRYEGKTLLQTEHFEIPMRCYQPEELVEVVEDHGFRVTGRWGGYHGEVYGEGPELVIRAVTGAGG